MKTQHTTKPAPFTSTPPPHRIFAGAGMTTLGPACLPQQKSEEQNTQMNSMRTADAPRIDAEKAGFNAQRSAPPLRATNLKPDPAQNLATEIALVQRVAQGDRESFEALYDRFSGVLFSTAYRILNNQHAAEDTLQEVFIQIWEKASFYDPALGKPMTWAVTLTRHKAIDRLRSTQRRSRLQDEAQRESETVEQLDDRSSIDAVASGETSVLVRAAIQNLSKEQREAIELAFYSSLTQSEIADRLKEPIGTIKARIRRGMIKLRNALSPEFGPASIALQAAN